MSNNPLLRSDFIPFKTNNENIKRHGFLVGCISMVLILMAALILFLSIAYDKDILILGLISGIAIIFSITLSRYQGTIGVRQQNLIITGIKTKYIPLKQIRSCMNITETRDGDEAISGWIISTGTALNPFNVYYLFGRPELELHKHLPLDRKN